MSDPDPNPECNPVSVPLRRKDPVPAVPVPAALTKLNPDPIRIRNMVSNNECLATRQP